MREKLSYANVTATIALFLALGGTGYAAVSLPRNSVGSAQIRSRAVGPSELRTRAVSSRAIRDGTVSARDISRSARASLTGPAGPQGPAGTALRAAVPAGGTVQRGNAISAAHQSGTNEYRVDFGRDLAPCVATATLATVPAGAGADQPAAGRVTVAQAASAVVGRTFAADGTPAEQPFHVTVSC
jgi:hypothetical protein